VRGDFLQVAVSDAPPEHLESTTRREMGVSDTALRLHDTNPANFRVADHTPRIGAVSEYRPYRNLWDVCQLPIPEAPD